MDLTCVTLVRTWTLADSVKSVARFASAWVSRVEFIAERTRSSMALSRRRKVARHRWRPPERDGGHNDAQPARSDHGRGGGGGHGADAGLAGGDGPRGSLGAPRAGGLHRDLRLPRHPRLDGGGHLPPGPALGAGTRPSDPECGGTGG